MPAIGTIGPPVVKRRPAEDIRSISANVGQMSEGLWPVAQIPGQNASGSAVRMDESVGNLAGKEATSHDAFRRRSPKA
jgi:hypothetical protein